MLFIVSEAPSAETRKAAGASGYDQGHLALLEAELVSKLGHYSVDPRAIFKALLRMDCKRSSPSIFSEQWKQGEVPKCLAIAMSDEAIAEHRVHPDGTTFHPIFFKKSIFVQMVADIGAVAPSEYQEVWVTLDL